MTTEADTCRTYVIPILKTAGWEDDDIAEQPHIVVYLDGLYPSGHLRQAKVNTLRELQVKSWEELRPLFGRTLMPSIPGKAFESEL
jgi:hypothetical protein